MGSKNKINFKYVVHITRAGSQHWEAAGTQKEVALSKGLLWPRPPPPAPRSTLYNQPERGQTRVSK